MDLSNVPGRAVRKVRQDGAAELISEGRDLVVDDLLLYRTVYKHLLEKRVDILYRDDVRNRSECLEYEEYNEPMRLKGPTGFRGLDTPEQYEPGNRFVCEFPDAMLLGPVGPGLTAEGTVIADTVGTPPLTQRRTGVTIARSISENGARRTLDALRGDGEPDRRFDTVAFAVPPWNNYYHWTVECLLRVRLLERYGSETGIYPTLLVPADCSSWMKESLDIIDYTGEIASFDGGVAKANSLVVPTFPDPIPEECFWMRNRMRDGTVRDGGSDEERSNRIYIARGDATVRRVSNRDAVQRVLDEYNVNTYLLGELSVREQIDLFRRADVVVAPHGAGLTNILYGDDLTVIELFGDKTMATFDRLAASMDHEYRYVQCEQVGVDVRVDTDTLAERLQTTIRT
ncbi:DUF563 domain-containing protein [Natrinema versiforme]|uniref:Glycosyltransferase family 61 protein n=1 Tax=Natrinema versiforme TaxID=88724 RepID=A0A4P8WES0_9EURY|nr:glycosyltransferase family 61 protein [Natrinema versiforme]QCS41778.1 glycosyltransferase family 61 protein [Natrinema versiforme]